MTTAAESGHIELRVSADAASYAAREDPLAHLLLELVPQFPPPAAGEQKLPVEMAMVLDVSGSMDMPSKYPLLRKAVETLMESLAEVDRLALVLFSESGYLLSPLAAPEAFDTRINELLVRMDASPVTFGGATRMTPGLVQALDELELKGRPGAVRRIYCLTDGELHDPEPCKKMISEIQRAEIDVQIYGFGGEFSVEQLAALVFGLPGSSVKPLLETEQVVATFRHLAGTAASVVARDLELEVSFAEDVVCGDAFQFRPREVLLGAIEGGRLSHRITAVERARTYALMFEVRLPPAEPETETVVAAVTARYWHGRDAEYGVERQTISLPRAEEPGEPVERLQKIRDLLLGLRENDRESQLARFRAKIELYRAERRDPALIAALERQLEVLLDPESATPLSEQDQQYIESDLMTREMEID